MSIDFQEEDNSVINQPLKSNPLKILTPKASLDLHDWGTKWVQLPNYDKHFLSLDAHSPCLEPMDAKPSCSMPVQTNKSENNYEVPRLSGQIEQKPGNLQRSMKASVSITPSSG